MMLALNPNTPPYISAPWTYSSTRSRWPWQRSRGGNLPLSTVLRLTIINGEHLLSFTVTVKTIMKLLFSEPIVMTSVLLFFFMNRETSRRSNKTKALSIFPRLTLEVLLCTNFLNLAIFSSKLLVHFCSTNMTTRIAKLYIRIKLILMKSSCKIANVQLLLKHLCVEPDAN